MLIKLSQNNNYLPPLLETSQAVIGTSGLQTLLVCVCQNDGYYALCKTKLICIIRTDTQPASAWSSLAAAGRVEGTC